MREFVLAMIVLTESYDMSRKVSLAFALYDRDASGFLTRDEVVHVLRGSLLFSANEIESMVDYVFREFDTDGDGLLSQSDFGRLLAQHPQYASLAVSELVFEDIPL